MATYRITDQTDYSDPEVVRESHFGANLVTIFDEEYGDPSSNLSDLVEEMGIENLRFPGGSATEHYFDMTDPNASVSSYAPSQTLLPMDQMFEQAGRSGIAVSIVIPTKRAFTQSAAEALLDGNYGDRQQVSAAYLRDLRTFVSTIIQEAQENGVEISGLELGNEFWGSGEMTAREYGRLVAIIAPEIDAVFAEAGLETPHLIVQSISSASWIFSPLNDTQVFVDPDGGEQSVHNRDYALDQYDGNVPSDWIPATVPAQGTAFWQVANLVEEINAVPGSADLVGGIVNHLYENNGFDAIDTGSSFLFDQYRRFENLLDRSDDLPDLCYHVSEWNARANHADNNRGLQHASMISEMFYEQVTHGIDATEIWPLTFDLTQNITMTDVAQDSLTIAGEMFGMMRENLVGLSPIVDWEVEGSLDIQGYGNNQRFVFIVSERSGSAQTDINFDFSEIVGDRNYFVTYSTLSDGLSGGADPRATPVWDHGEGITSQHGRVTADLSEWSITFIEFTRVGRAGDEVTGNNSNDVIRGYAGDDVLNGGAGHDRVFGGSGDDTVEGGSGFDRIFGGGGSDDLTGGGGRGTFRGGAGNDTIDGGAGQDQIIGGNGNDDLTGGHGNDTLRDGSGADTLTGGEGADHFIFAYDNRTDRVTDFNAREDIINLRSWNADSAEDFTLRTVTSSSGGIATQISFSDDVLIVEGVSRDQMANILETDAFLF